jgi:hypothetical protein
MRFAKGIHAPRDLREKVSGAQFQIIVVKMSHVGGGLE